MNLELNTVPEAPIIDLKDPAINKDIFNIQKENNSNLNSNNSILKNQNTSNEKSIFNKFDFTNIQQKEEIMQNFKNLIFCNVTKVKYFIESNNINIPDDKSKYDGIFYFLE